MTAGRRKNCDVAVERYGSADRIRRLKRRSAWQSCRHRQAEAFPSTLLSNAVTARVEGHVGKTGAYSIQVYRGSAFRIKVNAAVAIEPPGRLRLAGQRLAELVESGFFAVSG